MSLHCFNRLLLFSLVNSFSSPSRTQTFTLLRKTFKLQHLSDKFVDLVLSVAEVTTLDIVVGFLLPSTSGVVEFEVPQEVGGLFEMWAHSDDFMNQVLDTDDVELAEGLLNHLVLCDPVSLLLDLRESSLVDQLPDCADCRISPGDEGFSQSQHVQSSLVQSDEDTVVDLSQSQKLQNFPWLGSKTIDTSDPDHEGQLGLSWNVVVAGPSSGLQLLDLVSLDSFVLTLILHSSFENLSPLLDPSLPLLYLLHCFLSLPL